MTLSILLSAWLLATPAIADDTAEDIRNACSDLVAAEASANPSRDSSWHHRTAHRL